VDIGKREAKEGMMEVDTHKGKGRIGGKDRRVEGIKKNHLHYKSAFLAWCCGV
jgi:hypothetical protein